MDPIAAVPLAVALALLGPAGAPSSIAATVAISPGMTVAAPVSVVAPSATDRGPDRSDVGQETPSPARPSSRSDLADSRWIAPVTPLRVVRAFDAPAQNWLPGHRGVDLRAAPGTPVRAPAAGRVAFSGMVAGRPVVSIDHDDPSGAGTLRTTYEPVVARLAVGEAVGRGGVVGEVSSDPESHCARGCLHWGARRGQAYLDPLSFLRAAVRLWPPTGSTPQRGSVTG